MKTYTDSQLRAHLLKHFYALRKEYVDVIELPGQIMPDGSETEFHRIVGQLVEYNLASAEELIIPCPKGYTKKYQYISLTVSGIIATEREMSERLPLDFSVTNHFITLNQPSGSVHIGDNVTIIKSIRLLEKKIDESTASDLDKSEAKSLIKKMMDHPLTSTIIGSILGAAIS